jgi:hypothetical protein
MFRRLLVASGLAVIGALALFCAGCDEDTTAPDYARPAAATLSTASRTSNSITLQWIAPGDDGHEGRASVYDLRYSTTSSMVPHWWDSVAVRFEGAPAPRPAGERDSLTVDGLEPATTYYFALRTGDEVPNWSSLSNVHAESTRTAFSTVVP